MVVSDCITDKLTILKLILQHTNISKSHIAVRPLICLVHPTDDNIIEKLILKKYIHFQTQIRRPWAELVNQLSPRHAIPSLPAAQGMLISRQT